jgi:hypothetical protein
MTSNPDLPAKEPDRASRDLADERKFVKVILFTAPMGVGTVAALAVATVFDIPPIWHLISFGFAVLFVILTCVGLYKLLGVMDRGQQSTSLNPHGRNK